MGGGASREHQQMSRVIAARNKQQNEENLRQALAGYRAAGIIPEQVAAAKAAAVQSKARSAASVTTLQHKRPPQTEVGPAERPPVPEEHPGASQRKQGKMPRPNPALRADHYRNKLQTLREKRRESLSPSGRSIQSTNTSKSGLKHGAGEVGTINELKLRPDTAPAGGRSQLAGARSVLMRPFSALSELVHVPEPEPEEVDEESKRLWAELDKVARGMAAKVKERDDKIAAIRKQQREEEEERARVEAEHKRLREAIRRAQWEKKEEENSLERERQSAEELREKDPVQSEKAMARIEQVRTAVEELMLLEFETEEESEAVLQDYVERMKILEEEEEEMIRKRKESFLLESHGGLDAELHEFLPSYMQDLRYGPNWHKGARRRPPQVQQVNLQDYLVADSDSSDSESAPAPTKLDRNKIRRGRIKRAKSAAVADTDETEFEVLMDAAFEHGLSQVVQVLVTYAKKISKDKARSMAEFRSAIAKKFPLPDVKTWPGYHMYYLPLKQDISSTFQAAKGVMSDAVKPVTDLREKFRRFRDMEMGDEWKIANEHALQDSRFAVAGYGMNIFERAEELHLVQHKTIVTRHQQLVDQALGKEETSVADTNLPNGNKRKMSKGLLAMSKLMMSRDNQSQQSDVDEYSGAQRVGAILAAEGDKRGDYFGEVDIVMGEPRRHGLGLLLDRKLGSRIQGQWASNILQGFAAEMKSDQSYSIGLYENGKLSGLGWRRPQPGAKFGYVGAFHNGQSHGFGFKVSLLQERGSNRSESREQTQRNDSLEEPETPQSTEVKMSGRRPESTFMRLADRERPQRTGIMALSSSMLYYQEGELVDTVEGITELEIDGFKARIAKFLQLAFFKVKEAGEYAGGDQPWLQDVDRLIFLLKGHYDPTLRTVMSEPGTPVSEDADFAYLQAVSESRPVSAGGQGTIAEKSSKGVWDSSTHSPTHSSSSEEQAGTQRPTNARPENGGMRNGEWHITTAYAPSARSTSASSRSSGSGRNLGRPPSHPRKASAHTALDPLHLSHVENSTEPIPNISVPLHAQTNVQYQLSHQHAIYARPLSSGSGGWRVRGQASDDNIGIENRHEYTRPWSGRRVVGESDSDGGAATRRLAPHPGQNDVYVRPSSGGP